MLANKRPPFSARFDYLYRTKLSIGKSQGQVCKWNESTLNIFLYECSVCCSLNCCFYFYNYYVNLLTYLMWFTQAPICLLIYQLHCCIFHQLFQCVLLCVLLRINYSWHILCGLHFQRIHIFPVLFHSFGKRKYSNLTMILWRVWKGSSALEVNVYIL